MLISLLKLWMLWTQKGTSIYFLKNYVFLKIRLKDSKLAEKTKLCINVDNKNKYHRAGASWILIPIVKRNFPGIFFQKNWLFLTVQWCRVKHVACLLSPGTWRGSCTNYYDYRRWHGHHYSCSAFRIGYDVYAFALLVVILVL